MNNEQRINMAVAHNGITQAELARRIGMTPSNFNQKLKRDTFTAQEWEAIATALDAEYHAYLEFSDGIKL